MKPKYYGYIALVIVLIVIIAITTSSKPAVVVAPASDTTQNTNTPGTPATATNLAKSQIPVTTAVPNSIVGTTVNIKAIMLPDYYAQQIASTTLDIHVSSPSSNTISGSPVAVTGEARGAWYFEGSFPIVLTNLNGGVIATGHATAQSNWTTTDFVPFSASLV